MPDVREYQSVVEEAEQAAGAGDFARANACLRDALQIQESTLGPTHPDLASTLNNLAVVCETVGEIDDAERFYRRAFAIASGSLPPDDALVATSRDNLKDFCAARSRPVEEWPGIGRPEPAVLPPAAAVPAAPPVAHATPPPARPSGPARSVAAVAPAPPADAPWSKRVIGVVALLAVVGLVVVVRSWRAPAPQESATAVAAPTAAAAVPEPAPATPPAPPPQSAATTAPLQAPPPVRPTTSTSAPAAEPARAERATRSAPAATPAGVRVIVASVCASLSTSGAWRCDAVDGVTAPGRAAFYTRIASPSAMRVQHRWYHGTSLRQSVTLSIAANPSAGYRTFSRQTLSPGAWRVELRAADGSVLREVAFDVR